VVKRLTAVLAFLGLLVATVLLRVILNITCDALGWVGLANGLGFLVFVAATTPSQKEPESPEPSEPAPTV
jgi:uncharacterized membrane protein YjjB (DUF3815 family)